LKLEAVHHSETSEHLITRLGRSSKEDQNLEIWKTTAKAEKYYFN
jgi:hypothetical protein